MIAKNQPNPGKVKIVENLANLIKEKRTILIASIKNIPPPIIAAATTKLAIEKFCHAGVCSLNLSFIG